jgi:hypothetical protein
MINPGKDVRLTDELERQLMMQAIEEHLRFKRLFELNVLIDKVATLWAADKTVVQRSASTAN